MDKLTTKILSMEKPSNCSTALMTTGVCASFFLRNVRMGNLGLVKNNIAMNLAGLPLWFLDWLMDMAMGGGIKYAIHNIRVAMRGTLSVSSSIESGIENSACRVNPQVASNHGTLVTSPEAGVITLHDLVTNAFEKFSDWPCVGSRELLEYRVSTSTD
jgi:hypothetical protein